MRAFRLKLVEKLLEEPRALSRNRHFDTFDDATGRAALRTVRHLRALEREILHCAQRGLAVETTETDRKGERVMRLHLPHLRAKRVAYLSRAEFELLLGRPGIKQALGLP